MSDSDPDKNPAKISAKDDCGEGVGLLEPLVLSQGTPHRPALGDLALELAQAASGFRRSLIFPVIPDTELRII